MTTVGTGGAEVRGIGQHPKHALARVLERHAAEDGVHVDTIPTALREVTVRGQRPIFVEALEPGWSTATESAPAALSDPRGASLERDGMLEVRRS